MSLLKEFLTSFHAMSFWELFAVTLALLYIILSARISLWCWPAAFLSTLIYTIIFWNGTLFMESLLNFYYMLMAIYGWFSWKNTKGENSSNIKTLSYRKNITLIVSIFFISILIGFFLENNTHASLPYLDSFTTCFSIATTFMLARKVLENWLYWIVIDIVSIYIYIEKGYFISVFLFIIYTIMAFLAFLLWFKEYRKESISTYI